MYENRSKETVLSKTLDQGSITPGHSSGPGGCRSRVPVTVHPGSGLCRTEDPYLRSPGPVTGRVDTHSVFGGGGCASVVTET